MLKWLRVLQLVIGVIVNTECFSYLIVSQLWYMLSEILANYGSRNGSMAGGTNVEKPSTRSGIIVVVGGGGGGVIVVVIVVVVVGLN